MEGKLTKVGQPFAQTALQGKSVPSGKRAPHCLMKS